MNHYEDSQEILRLLTPDTREREIESRYRPGSTITASVENMQQAGLDIHYLRGSLAMLRSWVLQQTRRGVETWGLKL